MVTTGGIMRAARIEIFGGPEMVQVADVPRPALGPGQVLVDVSGSSINPVDIAVRSGWMAEFVPVMPPLTLGTDIAGIVSDVGEGVADLSRETRSTVSPAWSWAGPAALPIRR